MAQELFGANLTPGPLVKKDPRLKLLILFIFTPLVFQHHPIVLPMDIILILAGLYSSNLNPWSFLKNSSGILSILIFFILLGGREQLETTTLFSSRLFLTYSAGILFIRTTPAQQIRHALSWFLLPLPGRIALNISTSIGLVFSMFPMIMSEYHMIIDAQKCRGSEKIKNPAKRIIAPLFPLLVNSIVRSEIMGIALESRAWDSDIPKQALLIKLSIHPLNGSWKRNDSISFVLSILIITTPLILL